MKRKLIAPMLIGGYALLLVAWTFGNPPFASPDEVAHYLRALDVGEGEIIGEPAQYPATGLTQLQQDWVNQASRQVEVPAGLYPLGFGCNAGISGTSAACMNKAGSKVGRQNHVIPNGTYQPTLYPLPGLFAKGADDPAEGDYRGRIMMMLLSLSLIAVAVAVLASGQDSPLALVGLMVGITPMVLYIGSTLSPSGPEIAAGVCLGACLMRLSRDEKPHAGIWFGVAVSACILVLSKSLGPGLLILIGISFFAWNGWRRIILRIKDSPKQAATTAAVVVAATVVNRLWEAAYGPQVKLGTSLSIFLDDLEQMPQVIRQFIGIFGYLEVSMPRSAYLTWYVALGLISIAALVVGRMTQRFGLVVTGLIAYVTPAFLSAAMLRHTGFGVQGRHTLAAAVFLPVLAGETIYRNRARLPRLIAIVLPSLVALMVGTVQFAAWYTNARRAAVGIGGPIWFAGHSEWVPPAGWTPWALCALAGSLLLVAAGTLVSASEK
ncbi:MAG: DUF2142 domain-containing protein [Actinomycetota bacterium]